MMSRYFAVVLFVLVYCFWGMTVPVKAQTCQTGSISLSATPGPDYNQITLTWNGNPDSNGYAIYGSPDGGATWGDPLSGGGGGNGSTIVYAIRHWGISAPLRTNRTYHFFVATNVCGVYVASNVVSATTRDFDAPSVTMQPSTEFERLDFSWTGVGGASQVYAVYGSPDGVIWGQPNTASVAPGDFYTYTAVGWQILSSLETNKTYYFQVGVCADDRCKNSNIVSGKTRDIDAPQISAAIQSDNSVKLRWNTVIGATVYKVFAFSTTQNQWLFLGQVYPPETEPPTYIDAGAGVNGISQYMVTANRTSRARESNIVRTSFFEDQNYGNTFCNMAVGEPVNLSNGNMFINHTDYVLPGFGGGINVTRTYNSAIQSAGYFGFGWTSIFDENIQLLNQYTIRYMMGDGRAVYFGRTDPSQPFEPVTAGFYGQIILNTDNTFVLTFKDGAKRKFNASGRLLWLRDRNRNQTTFNYNGSGVLTDITDAFGRTLTVTINGSGSISQIGDALGTAATYEYEPGTSRLKKVTYGDGSQYKFEYTTVNNKLYLTAVRDALDNILEAHQYDSQGRAYTSEKHGGTDKYTLDYTHGGDASPYTTVTDALGRTTKYYFDKSSGRNVITKIEGNCNCGSGSETTIFEYDTRANPTKKTDALGRQTVYTYDGSGNRLTMTDVLGTETFTYNALGEILTATDRMSGVTTNVYDTSGNLLTTTDALGKTTTLTYTTLGQIKTVKDALDHTTTLTYDAQGRLTQVKDANNKTTTFGYDTRARLTTRTNALNQATTYQYDLNNRLKKVIFADTNFAEYTYDLAGRRTQTKDARGFTTTFGYDAAYRLTTVTDALNHTATLGYDLMSNRTSMTDALNQTTNYEYDDFNRLKKVKYPAAQTGATRLEEILTYDAVGNVKTRIDTAGRTTGYDYDTANRLQKTTDALLQITQFEYNARSQMTKVTDAAGQIYDFGYDALGRQLTQTRAGATMSYEYDAVGNRTKRTDYAGRETTYNYDNLNRLTQINYLQSLNGVAPLTPIKAASYGYDDLSRLTSATNDAGTVSFTYDNRGRLKTTTDVFGHLLEYGYDASGNRTQLKLDNAVFTGYAYDDASRLTTLTDEASQNFTFGYDVADKLTSKTMPNGISTTYDYDGMSRLKRLKNQSVTATLTDNNFTYNAANQISQIAELAQTKIFTYDNVDRLTGMTNGVANESYNFDAVGNRNSSHRSSSYGYQPNNRLVSTQTGSYSYDANGNMLSKSDTTGYWIYSWDYENRMVSARNRNKTVRYQYDALGRRVSRLGKGVGATAKYTYDGLDVIMDDGSDGIVKYQNAPGIDNKLKLTSGGVSKYFLQDHLGSTVGLTNSSGAVTSSASYDSFGNSTNNLTTRFQFTGREKDEFTGLQYNRARWYSSEIGRFISEDPIGFRSNDINLYGYVRNNPYKWKDPLGKDIWGIAVGGSGGVGIGDGVAGSVSTLYGVSGSGFLSNGAFDLGTASSMGLYTGNGCQNPQGEVFGFGGGLSISLVGSNARGFSDLQGPFDSHFIGLGPVSIEIDIGSADDGFPIGVGQIGIGIPGLSAGKFGYAHYGTNTPSDTIGTAKGLISNLTNGISNLYGSRYRF